MIACAYLPAAAADGEVEVETLGAQVPRDVAADVLYDPGNVRVRA